MNGELTPVIGSQSFGWWTANLLLWQVHRRLNDEWWTYSCDRFTIVWVVNGELTPVAGSQTFGWWMVNLLLWQAHSRLDDGELTPVAVSQSFWWWWIYSCGSFTVVCMMNGELTPAAASLWLGWWIVNLLVWQVPWHAPWFPDPHLAVLQQTQTWILLWSESHHLFLHPGSVPY